LWKKLGGNANWRGWTFDSQERNHHDEQLGRFVPLGHARGYIAWRFVAPRFVARCFIAPHFVGPRFVTPRFGARCYVAPHFVAP
jgi:hypothetical protein